MDAVELPTIETAPEGAVETPEVVETPETPELNLPEIGDEPGETAEPQEGQPETAAPTQIKAADIVKFLREQKEANPANANLLRTLQDRYFSAQDFNSLFPKIEEARTVKATLEAVGGMEGIAHLQEVEQSLEALDQRVATGDPAFIEELSKEFPDGFKRLVPAALETLGKLDAAAYQSVVAPIAIQAIMSSPLISSFELLNERLQSGEVDGAKRELARIGQMLSGWAEYANQPKAAQAPLEAPSSQIDAQLGTKVGDTLVAHITKGIEGDLKESLAKMTPQAKSDLISSILNELDAEIGKNKAYMQNMSSLLRKGLGDRAISYGKAMTDGIRTAIAKSVFERRYGLPSASPTGKRAATKPAPPNPVNPNKEVLLAREPKGENINWGKTSRTMYITGRAYLTDGRLVRWTPA